MIVDINNKKIEVKECNHFIERLLGLMLKKEITVGLCFPRCNCIHTFFMFNKIDVIMTDKDNNVLYIYNGLKPWRLLLPKKDVYYTYELPINSINNLKIADKIKKLEN